MRRSCLLFLLAAFMTGIPASAQSILANSEPITVTLGQSLVPLTGPWKFHIGDNPQWADTAFDDSQWETVDLTPKTGAFDPSTGLKNFVPGWTAKGHPGYSGYAWYRIQTLLAQPVTASQIAAAAQKFGQQDDISILSITRIAVLEEALA